MTFHKKLSIVILIRAMRQSPDLAHIDYLWIYHYTANIIQVEKTYTVELRYSYTVHIGGLYKY